MNDNEYLGRRAEAEAVLATQSTNPAVAAHYQLSTAYLERLHAQMPANDRAEGDG